MKQVLIVKLKLAPTTELLNFLRDVLLASRTLLNYASWVAWLSRSQMSHLIGEYISLLREMVLLRYSFVLAPKLATELTTRAVKPFNSPPGMQCIFSKGLEKVKIPHRISC
jgi:hypothetical protein